MARYTIKRVKVQVEYDNKDSGWFDIELGPDTRTILLGMDALGAAGTHERPERAGLRPITQADFDCSSAQDSGKESSTSDRYGSLLASLPRWFRRRLEPRLLQLQGGMKTTAGRGVMKQSQVMQESQESQELQGLEESQVRAMLLAAERSETPDVCEYRNGKWYCWPSEV